MHALALSDRLMEHLHWQVNGHFLIYPRTVIRSLILSHFCPSFLTFMLSLWCARVKRWAFGPPVPLRLPLLLDYLLIWLSEWLSAHPWVGSITSEWQIWLVSQNWWAVWVQQPQKSAGSEARATVMPAQTDDWSWKHQKYPVIKKFIISAFNVVVKQKSPQQSHNNCRGGTNHCSTS